MNTKLKYLMSVLLFGAGAFFLYSLNSYHKMFQDSFVYANLAILAGADIRNYLLPIAVIMSDGNIVPLSIQANVIIIVIGVALMLFGLQVANLTYHKKPLSYLLSARYWTEPSASFRADMKINEKEWQWFEDVLVALRLKKRKLTEKQKEARRAKMKRRQAIERKKLKEQLLKKS